MIPFILTVVIFIGFLGYMVYESAAASVSTMQTDYDKALRHSQTATIIGSIAIVMFLLMVCACLYIFFTYGGAFAVSSILK